MCEAYFDNVCQKKPHKCQREFSQATLLYSIVETVRTHNAKAPTHSATDKVKYCQSRQKQQQNKGLRALATKLS